MENTPNRIAQLLLKIKAIKLSPSEPFTWASGWKSPIYCDNRKTLSYPEVRNAIRDGFKAVIEQKYPGVDGIVGVATGAIAHGMLVADIMELPFIYVRSSAKGHGMQNLIEGEYKEGGKYVVIEDLVSTGGSSLKAVEALRSANCDVLGMVAIFSYGFQAATDKFAEHNCTLDTLSNYNTLIEEAASSNYINTDDIEILKKWRTSPNTWMQE